MPVEPQICRRICRRYSRGYKPARLQEARHRCWWQSRSSSQHQIFLHCTSKSARSLRAEPMSSVASWHDAALYFIRQYPPSPKPNTFPPLTILQTTILPRPLWRELCSRASRKVQTPPSIDKMALHRRLAKQQMQTTGPRHPKPLRCRVHRQREEGTRT